MASLLCLWDYDSYQRDEKSGVFDEQPSYNSRQKALHSKTLFGGNVFLATCVEHRCYLTGRLVVGKKVITPPGFEYGPYGLVGATGSSYYPIGKIDVTDILSELTFEGTKLRIPKTGDLGRKPLPQYLQTARQLNPDDVALLKKTIRKCGYSV